MANRRFLRKLARLQAMLLAALMVIGMAQPSVKAYADDPDYRYKIRIFSGNQGTIDGEDMVEDFLENLPIGTKCTIQVEPTSEKSTLTLKKDGVTKTYEIKLKNNSKYYVKGIRESGRDNNIAVPEIDLAEPNFTVKQDMDYVIAYGVKGKMVKYTIRFQDKSGKPLADSEEYYGKVGDKPVVAALYVDGYVPDANNKTGTLQEKESGNVWTFVYNKKPAESKSSSSSKTKTITTTKTTTRHIVNNQTTEADDDEDDADAEDEDEEESKSSEASDNTPEAAEDVPDIVDIDEEETSGEEDSTESEIEIAPEDESEIESVETETIAETTIETTGETTAETTAETVAQTVPETRETIDIRDTRNSKSGVPTVMKAGIGIGVLGVVAGGVWYYLNKRRNP